MDVGGGRHKPRARGGTELQFLHRASRLGSVGRMGVPLLVAHVRVDLGAVGFDSLNKLCVFADLAL